jgi:hypothetical protein
MSRLCNFGKAGAQVRFREAEWQDEKQQRDRDDHKHREYKSAQPAVENAEIGQGRGEDSDRSLQCAGVIRLAARFWRNSLGRSEADNKCCGNSAGDQSAGNRSANAAAG